MRNFMILGLILVLNGCAFFQNRTFIDKMNKDSDGFWVAGQDYKVVSGDEGEIYRTREEIIDRTPTSLRQREKMEQVSSLKNELVIKENRLRGRNSAMYGHYLNKFKNDSEKIYFLSLNAKEQRDYLRSRGVTDFRNHYAPTPSRSPSSYLSKKFKTRSSLFLGMAKGDVERAWGDPMRVDIAGDPKYQNERWAFKTYRGVHFVYFENGVVQGWATE